MRGGFWCYSPYVCGYVSFVLCEFFVLCVSSFVLYFVFCLCLLRGRVFHKSSTILTTTTITSKTCGTYGLGILCGPKHIWVCALRKVSGCV